MNKDVVISAWLVSFLIMVLSANNLGAIFWLSFVAFAFTSYSLKRISENIK